MTTQRKTLKDLRTERGWSREELAVKLGVSLTTVANLETGKHEPRLMRARLIAELFGVPMDAIEWGAAPQPAGAREVKKAA